MDRANHLARLTVGEKTGHEPFHRDGQSFGFDLLEFWQWSCSDLLGNTMRGIIAEFLVAKALGATARCRTEWDAYDVLDDHDGRSIKVEVKSSAYLQSWAQAELSRPSFGVAPTLGWDAESNTFAEERSRQSDVYVFALLAHRDKATADPLNVAQWEFFVVPTERLDSACPTQRTISLAGLASLGCEPVEYDRLAESIRDHG